jgi:hypothetical protein
MPSLRVTFDAGEARRELDRIPADQLIHITEPDWQLIGIDRGMSSGRAAIALRINLPDGQVLVVESSAAIWVTSARALMGRYPELDAGPHMSDEQFAELQRLLAAQVAAATGVPAEDLAPRDQNRAAAGAPTPAYQPTWHERTAQGARKCEFCQKDIPVGAPIYIKRWGPSHLNITKACAECYELLTTEGEGGKL